MKRLIATFAAAAGLVLGGAGVASAGEVNGNGAEIPAPDRAASACVYSGLDSEDNVGEVNPPGLDDDELAMRGNQSPGGVDRFHGVQSYGIFVRAGLKEFLPSPGMACNGSGG